MPPRTRTTTAVKAPAKRTTKVTSINAPTRGVVALDTVRAEKVKWLWPGYLPEGKLVILDGDPSTGKSTLCIDLAARVSAGLKWPDETPFGSKGGAGVILMTAEDSLADTIVPRLQAAGGDSKKVFAMTEVPDENGNMRPPALPTDIGRLEKEIVKHKVKLVVVDVLMAFLAANSMSDQSVRAVLSPLKDMAERTGATIIMIRHVTKSKNKNSLYRGSGSIGIVGAARAAYLLSRDPSDEDRRILRTTKNNLGPEAPALAYTLKDNPKFGVATIDWEEGFIDEEDLDRNVNRSEQDEGVDFLMGLLEAQPNKRMSRAEIMANAVGAGFSAATVKRAKDRAGIRHKSEGFPRTTYWYIAEW